MVADSFSTCIALYCRCHCCRCCCCRNYTILPLDRTTNKKKRNIVLFYTNRFFASRISNALLLELRVLVFTSLSTVCVCSLLETVDVKLNAGKNRS